jgi:hypothetical protein
MLVLPILAASLACSTFVPHHIRGQEHPALVLISFPVEQFVAFFTGIILFGKALGLANLIILGLLFSGVLFASLHQS